MSLLIAHFVILYLRTMKSDKFVCLDGKYDYLLQIVFCWELLLVSYFRYMVLESVIIPAFFSLFLVWNRNFIKESKNKIDFVINNR